ncbi:MAG: Ni,Fe-hydrogenase III large subunit, partial [Gammaproteobacteria bacterium]
MTAYLERLRDEHILILQESDTRLAPAHFLGIDPEDWGKAGEQAARLGYRWAGLWADPVKERVDIFCLLEYQGNYLVLGTR